MLNGVLIVGVPMVALLAAAFYVFRRTQREEQRQSPGRGSSARDSRFSGVKTGRPCSTNPRRRRCVHAGDGDHHHHDNDLASSSDSPDSGFADNEEQCEICFESTEKVQLYPCKHSDICRGCVLKLLLNNHRQCPFCRSRIDGYMELDDDMDLFGYLPVTRYVGSPLSN